jgi:hypothetical protein
MTNRRSHGIFEEFFPKYELAGYHAIPVIKNGKKPAVRNWMTTSAVSSADRKRLFQAYGDCNIGLLAGTRLSTGKRCSFVDVDHPGFVKFVNSVLGAEAPAKVGSKGATFFCQGDDSLGSRKIAKKGHPTPAVEIFISTGMTVVPPYHAKQ